MLLITIANFMFEHKHSSMSRTTAVIRIRSLDSKRMKATEVIPKVVLKSAVQEVGKDNKCHGAYMQLREHCNIKDANLCSNSSNSVSLNSYCKSSNINHGLFTYSNASSLAKQIKLLTVISSRESLLNNFRICCYKLNSLALPSQQAYYLLLLLLLLRLPLRQQALHQKTLYFAESDIR